MVQFASLIHKIMPSWLSSRKPAPPLPRDADAVWHEIVEKDTFGANTPDYTHVEDSDDRPRRQTKSGSRR